ncbi:MAG: hypothetical protein INR71_10010 [Terriglobus roseus]|nr:hypothetical protein [Terriglobus roseus]
MACGSDPSHPLSSVTSLVSLRHHQFGLGKSMIGSRLAGIEYHGAAGATQPCVKAVERLTYYECQIRFATILTAPFGNIRRHALLLRTEYDDRIAIKSGFASGHGGEGEKGLAEALSMLEWRGVELDEVNVDAAMIERIDESRLTQRDLERLITATPVRPSRLWDYIHNNREFLDRAQIWKTCKRDLPFALLDARLLDLALEFADDPDGALLKAHRRLEDILRSRLPKQTSGEPVEASRLFHLAFRSDLHLIWPNLFGGQREGLANLFSGSFSVYRNPRAHNEVEPDPERDVLEFLLINHLYFLERKAVEIPRSSDVSE